jgi:hypothetical protein
VPWLMPSTFMRRQASTIDCRIAASSLSLIVSLRMSARLAALHKPKG